MSPATAHHYFTSCELWPPKRMSCSTYTDMPSRNEWDRNPLPATTGEDRPKTRTLRVSFYYLDQDEPHPTDPDRSLLVPHAEAKYPVVDFEFDATESRAVRLRLGTDGRLAIWLKQHGASPNSRAFIYDWRKGLGLGVS